MSEIADITQNPFWFRQPLKSTSIQALCEYDYFMNFNQLDEAFRRIADEVCKSADGNCCWPQVLDIGGQGSNERLADLDVSADIEAVQIQLAEIFKASPPPESLSFLYFGLYERSSGTAYYVSGYESPDAIGTLTRGDEPSFFPANRHLSSFVLKAIDAEAAKTPTGRHALTYAVIFGAGAVLSGLPRSLCGCGTPSTWGLIPVTLPESSEQAPSCNDRCRKIPWVLKKSLSTPNGPKFRDAKCLGIRERRLNRIVMQSCFRQFLEKEFFNISNDVGNVNIY